MNRKSLITYALAGAFAFSTPMLYADDEKQEAPKPELVSQSDEQPSAPAPELISQSDEKQEAPKPELVSQSDEQPPTSAPAPELITA
jgi:hypothetical protein